MASPPFSRCPRQSLRTFLPRRKISPTISWPDTMARFLGKPGPCPRQMCRSEPQMLAQWILTKMSSDPTLGSGYSRNAISFRGPPNTATWSFIDTSSYATAVTLTSSTKLRRMQAKLAPSLDRCNHGVVPGDNTLSQVTVIVTWDGAAEHDPLRVLIEQRRTYGL